MLNVINYNRDIPWNICDQRFSKQDGPCCDQRPIGLCCDQKDDKGASFKKTLTNTGCFLIVYTLMCFAREFNRLNTDLVQSLTNR